MTDNRPNSFFKFVILVSIIENSKGLWCYQCVSTQPGCGDPFDWRWHSSVTCSSNKDRCVKITERKGAHEIITRNCLSEVQYSRHDVPADTYEGCHPAAKDVRLAHYVQNNMKELDIRRDYYDEVTWCFCEFDNFCNSSSKNLACLSLVILTTMILHYYFVF